MLKVNNISISVREFILSFVIWEPSVNLKLFDWYQMVYPFHIQMLRNEWPCKSHHKTNKKRFLICTHSIEWSRWNYMEENVYVPDVSFVPILRRLFFLGFSSITFFSLFFQHVPTCSNMFQWLLLRLLFLP